MSELSLENQITSYTTNYQQFFEQHESNARSYCRSFPSLFKKAKGSYLYDAEGRGFLDFFSGAGSLNYGHNPEPLKKAMLEHLENDYILHGLDMHTSPKLLFIHSFSEKILQPRGMKHRIQFTGPTGTNAVEAALKLARKVTGRKTVVAFTGAFHGVSLGALGVTANPYFRRAAGIELSSTYFIPHPDGPLGRFDSLGLLQNMVLDPSSGLEKPAAVIVEPVQGEGGCYIFPEADLAKLANFCHEHDIVLICDEVQAGCGRTGKFFSFEHSSIVPDIVVLSKSLSGVGIPFSVILIREDLDCWKPGEHNGTFRGNQLAFTTAAQALESYWSSHELADTVLKKEKFIRGLARQLFVDERIQLRGRGMFLALDLSNISDEGLAEKVAQECYANGLIIETCGRQDSCLKILPPLTISYEDLTSGLMIIATALDKIAARK
jgi:diaminobutyrate-2-oxoglutarate transaminase